MEVAPVKGILSTKETRLSASSFLEGAQTFAHLNNITQAGDQHQDQTNTALFGAEHYNRSSKEDLVPQSTNKKYVMFMLH
jgi:hypothetical protein